MRPGWYYPCAGLVQPCVLRYLRLHGARPEFVGRIGWYQYGGMLRWFCLRAGPVYIGPIPPRRLGEWPGSEYMTGREMDAIYVWRGSRYVMAKDMRDANYGPC